MSTRVGREHAGRRRWPGIGQRRSSDVLRHGGAPEAILERGRQHETAALRDRRYRRGIAVADAAAVLVAILLAGWMRGAAPALGALLAVPLILAMAKIGGLYDRDDLLIRKTTVDEAPRLLQLATVFTMLVWLADKIFMGAPLHKPEVLLLWVSSGCLLIVGRRLARAGARKTVPSERVLLVGDDATFRRVAAKFDHDDIKAELVGRVNMTGTHPLDLADRHAAERELRVTIEQLDVHRVLIDPSSLPPTEMLDFVRAAKGAGVQVSLVPRVHDVVGSSVVFDDLHGMTLLGVRRFGLSRSSKLLKRSFDLAGGVAITIAAAPMLAVIAALIKLDSRGPVLFRQTRVGRDGKHFRICKFRTMVPDAEALKDALRDRNEADGLFKMENDPRITRIGRLLRKTSLDELPQLFNVLGGSMSLVGPRPLVVDEDAQIQGWDRRRLHLTPGMTGHWQILGSARVPLHEMVKIDYLYAAGWSLWTDLKILLRTVPYVLARRGQ